MVGRLPALVFLVVSCLAAACGGSGVRKVSTKIVDAGMRAPAPKKKQALVMLVVDSSGSMELMPNCGCSTPGCQECYPDCTKGERNRFATVLEALTGSGAPFSCETLERTAQNGATYDEGYFEPFNRPDFGAQHDDGVLDRYRDSLRFGLATSDGFASYADASSLVPLEKFDTSASRGASGLWSYGAAEDAWDPNVSDLPGRFFFPGAPSVYFMDTGIRGPQASSGALRLAFDEASAPVVDDSIQRDLLGLRTYAGSSIASALDDLYYLFGEDVNYASTFRDDASDRYVVVISDGSFDDDYRTFGCNCPHEAPDPKFGLCSGASQADIAMATCPYPTPADAARYLVEGRSANPDDTAQRAPGPPQVARVYVVVLGDESLSEQWDPIASAGGTRQAYVTRNTSTLRTTLASIFGEIVAMP